MTDLTRCEATVDRLSLSLEESEMQRETCGRWAKTKYVIGNRAVRLCRVHDRKFRHLGGTPL